MSSFFGHDNQNTQSTKYLYIDPSCYHNGEFITLVDHPLASVSIYHGHSAESPSTLPTTLPATIAHHQMSVDTNIPADWEQPRDVFSAASYGDPVSFELSIDPRSLEDFASTFDDQSQNSLLQLQTNSSPGSQASTLASPPPDSPTVKKRRGCKPRALTNASSTIHHSHAHNHSHAHSHNHSSVHAANSRRPRRQSTTSVPTVSQPMMSLNNHDSHIMEPVHDNSRQSQLERNRIAAAKCRTKRTAVENKLTSYEHEMEDINSGLRTTHNELRQQVLNLKDIIHSHANCDCPLIKTFLANEAKRYVDSGADVEYNELALGAGVQEQLLESMPT